MRVWVPWVAIAAGCGGKDDLPGHVWDVTALAVLDECNDPTVPYEERFEYRVVYDGQEVELAIGEDVFATGTSSGCDIVYETAVWSDTRDDGEEVRWVLSGSAKARTDPGACTIEEDLDWFGTETFEIVFSSDPDIAQGCQYELEVRGTYQGEAE